MGYRVYMTRSRDVFVKASKKNSTLQIERKQYILLVSNPMAKCPPPKQ